MQTELWEPCSQLEVMGLDQGEVQAKCIKKYVNKIIAENSPGLGEVMVIQSQRNLEHQRHNGKWSSNVTL